MKTDWRTRLIDLPEGTTRGRYRDRQYQVCKTVLANGRVLKLFARELGGNNIISLNYYRLKDKDKLKPCEMPEEKVIYFLENLTPSPEGVKTHA